MDAQEPIADEQGVVERGRRNYRLGLISGATGGTAMAFRHPELIIAGLIYALTASPMLVALVTIISKAGILMPQLWASTHLEHRPRKMPYFVLVTIALGVALAGVIGTMCLLSRRVDALSLSAFFIPYGTEKLKFEGPGGLAVLGGILVATMQSSRLVTSILWGKPADRYGYRTCLVGGSVFFVLVPLLALLSPTLPSLFHLPIPGTGGTMGLPLAVYFLALIAMGAALQGMILGGNHFIVSHAPPRRRASYMGFQSAMSTPLTLLPLLGAFLANSVGMSSVFILAVSGGAIMLTGAVRMKPAAPTKAPMDRIASDP